VSTSLSTHVLDTEHGRPAQDVRVELHEGDRLLAEGRTDGDGRIADLAPGLGPGVYRLVFHPPSPFFRRVELEVELGEGHTHVPLLISSYACASYRGS
jgi:5-hydroxyisourate hydrolase